MTLPLFIVISSLAVVVAQAQGQSRREQRHQSPTEQACKTEIQQLCQGQTGQQAEQCLKNNESKLSSQCKSALSQTQTPQK